MRRLIWIVSAIAAASGAWADSEASNVPSVFADPYGRCYAKSIPAHVYDPHEGPRQQGQTLVYRVGLDADTLIDTYDWFSWKIYLLCGPVDVQVVRLGPWSRGHDPQADHLAIAFYQAGQLVKRYSTLAIAGPERSDPGSISQFRNVSASESHYTVFEGIPELTKQIVQDGAVFSEDWRITAQTVDGRQLEFDPVTGAMN